MFVCVLLWFSSRLLLYQLWWRWNWKDTSKHRCFSSLKICLEKHPLIHELPLLVKIFWWNSITILWFFKFIFFAKTIEKSYGFLITSYAVLMKIVTSLWFSCDFLLKLLWFSCGFLLNFLWNLMQFLCNSYAVLM